MRLRLRLLAICLLAGCSTAGDHHSLAESADVKTIDGVPIQRWLGARSALLFSKPIRNASTQPSQFALTMEPGTAYALAAAVDQRGDFLTAAHCASWTSITIVYHAKGEFIVEKPTVVWKDDAADLALIHVSRELDADLTWCDEQEIQPHSTVWAAGFDPASGQLSCMSGELIGVGHFSPSPNSPRYVQMNLPARPGDSGGAVIDGNGKLIGVITRGDESRHWCWAAAPTTRRSP